jgi:Tol biopolymer transport system component
MSRTLTLLFRRDPSRDRQTETLHFEGYEAFWPDGRTVALIGSRNGIRRLYVRPLDQPTPVEVPGNGSAA